MSYEYYEAAVQLVLSQGYDPEQTISKISLQFPEGGRVVKTRWEFAAEELDEFHQKLKVLKGAGFLDDKI